MDKNEKEYKKPLKPPILHFINLSKGHMQLFVRYYGLICIFSG